MKLLVLGLSLTVIACLIWIYFLRKNNNLLWRVNNRRTNDARRYLSLAREFTSKLEGDLMLHKGYISHVEVTTVEKDRLNEQFIKELEYKIQAFKDDLND